MNYKLSVKERSSGQSLIETVVAIFILTTGLASGLALAIFSFGASSEVSDKIVATGLAREGIEAVRRMRDSNWLVAKAAGKLATCLDLDPNGGQVCYATWLTERYKITGQTGSGISYRLMFDPNSSTNKWTLDSSVLSGPAHYRLFQQTEGLNHNIAGQPTKFFRQINLINAESDAPYSATSPLVLVRIVVWWHGKRCPTITYYSTASDTSCKLITEEYLSNWRNY